MTASASASVMFAAEFREVRPLSLDESPWDVFEVPAAAPAGVRADGRTYFRASYPTPRCIPARGHITLCFKGRPVHGFYYENGLPTVRSATMGADAERPQGCVGDALVCRMEMPATPSEIEADFAGYAALPSKKWVQLNSTADCFTVQARLRKMPPEDIYRDLGTGAYYVYGVDALVVHVRPKRAGRR